MLNDLARQARDDWLQLNERKCKDFRICFTRNELGFDPVCVQSDHRDCEQCEMDLIHDARHLCARLRTDGMKAMSRGFSGGKQVKNFAIQEITVEFFYS